MLDLTQNESLLTLLASAVLQPGLRSILVFDAPYTILQQLAELLAQLFAATNPQPIRLYRLAASSSDDELWGRSLFPSSTPEGFHWHEHLFSSERNAHEFQILTIADLSLLEQSAARSCLMLLDTPVVYVERNSEHTFWHPQQCWLAACSEEHIGTVSPHLLDRFALRLSWRKFSPQMPLSISIENRSARLQAYVPKTLPSPDVQLPSALLERIQQASQHLPELPDNTLPILEYFNAELVSPRRELALARLAYALAQWQLAPAVTSEHINAAAELFGFIPVKHKSAPESELLPKPSDPEVPQPEPVSPPGPDTQKSRSIAVPSHEQEHPQSVLLPGSTSTSQLPVLSALCVEAYPEDHAPVEREAASLKFPVLRSTSSRAARGPIIGVEPADTFQDLALISTILAASRFQTLRKRPPSAPMRFESIDLRRYRRSFASEHLLMLLLDYTSVRDLPDWQEALVPYLQSAYTSRACIDIIKIGAADACFPLQAELLSARSILVPRIALALQSEHGKNSSTPLAHGLAIALDRLHHVLQHGRSTISDVTLLVISDGRGNVPLQASLQNSLTSIVTREGIEDALTIAQKLRALKRVTCLVGNPQPRYYPALPQQLAEALGAGIFNLTQEVQI